jgi:hypothetical protein
LSDDPPENGAVFLSAMGVRPPAGKAIAAEVSRLSSILGATSRLRST